MRTNILIILTFVFCTQLYSQKPDLVIEEDYYKPEYYMTSPSLGLAPIIKEGLYVSNPYKNLGGSLRFQEGLGVEQGQLSQMSDMEFVILRLKGSKADQIMIEIKLERGGSTAIQFKYNDLGKYQLNKYDLSTGEKYITGGTIKINTGKIANIIRVEHRFDTLRYFVNNEFAVTHILNRKSNIYWNNCRIYSEESTIALDKVVFKGYFTPEDKLKKQQELVKKKEDEDAQKYANMGLPVKIKSQTHTLYAYAGWAGIFPNSEKSKILSSDYSNKTPSEVFNQGPNGWIKDATSLYPLFIMFSESDSSSLEREKEMFINLAKNRTGWATEKIKPIEESIIIPDGRKGLLLFYVCPDTKGMVGGNYFNCYLYLESMNDKTKITTYKIFIEGGNPDLPEQDIVAWKDYFKKVLLTITQN